MIRCMSSLAACVEGLYRTFASYPRPQRVSPCTFCWTEKEIEALRSVPLRKIEPELVRQLLWETADHWEDTKAYKHYLPRLLEAMTPSMGIEDLYPRHLFETLLYHGFAEWPGSEKDAVLAFIEELDTTLSSVSGLDSDSSQAEWRSAAQELRKRSIAGRPTAGT
jgi:hypothetical protein